MGQIATRRPWFEDSRNHAQFAVGGLILNPEEPIEMKFLCRQPFFEFITPRGVKFDEHLPFLHVQKNPACRDLAGRVKPADQFSCTLAREAGKRVLRHITWHLIVPPRGTLHNSKNPREAAARAQTTPPKPASIGEERGGLTPTPKAVG
jgi:hypothetical protein